MSQFLSDRRQRLRLNGKVNVSVDVVSRVIQGYFRTVVVYIEPLRALSHCWEP